MTLFMTDRWQQVEKLCQAALELEESQRVTFLEEACAGDEELRREVESLLKFDKQRGQFIEQPALEVAAKMVAQDKPESLIGQQIGSYQILSLLGAGGMGVVYQARDTRLKRLVALKVLPREKMTDPERKKRFIQEARSASALNHPNIITIYDIGTENGTDFIVMEHVSGKTLDQRIPRKGVKPNEALKLAIQIADALAKAHAAGIIHRDLKPSNVMVSDDGLVKLLDFGLAKLTEVGSKTGETLTRESLTEEGMIVGTVSYMSPEQAEGKKVDTRSDIFSFGSVLYEMVTGQKAFEGDTKMSTLAAIVKGEPKPIGQLVSMIPPELEKIINRCLRKDLARRFQTMADLKVVLEELGEESDSDKRTVTASRGPSTRQKWFWVGGAVVGVAIALTGWLLRGTGRRATAVPEVIPLTSSPGYELSPSFSPDGSQVVFASNGDKKDNFDIYLKLIGSSMPVRLTMDPARDFGPAFSPDGHAIGFTRVLNGRAAFMIIPAIGGSERLVADLPENLDYMSSFAWFPDGKWIVADGLTLLSTETGEMRQLTFPHVKSSPDFFPGVSPDGRAVAFSREVVGLSEIYLLQLTKDLRPIGEPRRLTFLNGFSFGPAWTPDGKEIVFALGIPGVFTGANGLWRMPASGAAKPERLEFAGGDARRPVLSRNGKRLAYQRVTLDDNIWRLPLSAPGVASGLPTRLTGSTRRDSTAQYSPDGKRIVFESDQTGVRGIWTSNADGSNATELFSEPSTSFGSASWSPDGQRIAFDFTAEVGSGVYVIRANGGKAVRLTPDSARDVCPSWSGDGKWIYFASPRNGRFEVWKVGAGGGKAIEVTQNGGGCAIESLTGESIYYTREGVSTALWKMELRTGEEEQIVPSVWGSFSPVREGIYFISQPNAGNFFLEFLNFASGKVNVVIPMTVRPSEGLSVSPDGRFLLFSQFDYVNSDLMLVENFR